MWYQNYVNMHKDHEIYFCHEMRKDTEHMKERGRGHKEERARRGNREREYAYKYTYKYAYKYTYKYVFATSVWQERKELFMLDVSSQL